VQVVGFRNNQAMAAHKMVVKTTPLNVQGTILDTIPILFGQEKQAACPQEQSRTQMLILCEDSEKRRMERSRTEVLSASHPASVVCCELFRNVRRAAGEVPYGLGQVLS
jgi:hypothetical protein